jgi:hypothetical protein
MGTDVVDVLNLAAFFPAFRKLAGAFSVDGRVVFKSCDIGQNQEPLDLSAEAFGVPVTGYTTPGRRRSPCTSPGTR